MNSRAIRLLRATAQHNCSRVLTLSAAVMAASLLLLFLIPASPARAAGLVVSNLQDSGPGSLRDAIAQAEATPGVADTITFSLSGVIPLNSTLPTITDTAGLTIDGGNNAITVSGGGNVRVFEVSGFDAKLDLKNITVSDGKVISPDPNGAGLVNVDGTVTVTNSTFSGNTVTGSDGQFSFGGGIDNNVGTLTVTNSTFSGNIATTTGGAAGRGGGLSNDFGTLTVINSTFSGNSATGSGGGIFNGRLSQAATVRNTIVANSPSGGNCFNLGTIGDGGYNIDDGITCGFSTLNNSQPSTNPLLDPNGLADNGGPTKTIALQQGSPAIDQIPQGTNSCGSTATNPIATDQRGVSRPEGTGCDIGAFEVQLPPVANDDSYSTNQDQPLSVPAPGVLANDTDPNTQGTMTALKVTDPTHGTLQLNPDGSLSYTPNPGFSGSDTFSYKAEDGAAQGNTATVTITVSSVPSPPGPQPGPQPPGAQPGPQPEPQPSPLPSSHHKHKQHAGHHSGHHHKHKGSGSNGGGGGGGGISEGGTQSIGQWGR